MTPADNIPPTGGEGSAPAAGSELSIPKHRFDEVAAELRRTREELAMKDRLYMEDRQRFSQAQQPRQTEPELSPEELGLDPQTMTGVKKLAQHIASGIVKQERQVFEQQIGMLANRAEKAEFLATHGSDKAELYPEIQRMQQEHFQRTGTFMPAEIAFKITAADAKDRRIRELEAQLAGKAPAPAAPTPTPTPQAYQPGAPSASGTRQMPTGGAPQGNPSASKSFSELSVEEMEAHMEQGFKAGNLL